MKQANRIDTDGHIVEPVIVDDGAVDTGDLIATSCPDGFHKPRWNGTAWVEGLSFITITSAPTANANEYAVTATISNPPAPAPSEVVFTIAGTTFTKPVASNKATITVSLHKVIGSQATPVVVTATGCVAGTGTIGGTAAPSTHTKATANGDGSVSVKNISKAEITAYYMAHTVSQSDIFTDLANWVDLLTSISLKLVGAAQQATYAPITLSADEQNAITDMTTNLLPKLRLKLSDAAPATGSTQTQNPRYSSIVTHKGQANTTADEYLNIINNDTDVI